MAEGWHRPKRFVTNSLNQKALAQQIHWHHRTSTDAKTTVEPRTPEVDDEVASNAQNWLQNLGPKLLQAYPLLEASSSTREDPFQHLRVDESVYTGYAGIAFFFMELHLKRLPVAPNPQQVVSECSSLDFARKYVDVALQNTTLWRDCCVGMQLGAGDGHDESKDVVKAVDLVPCRLHLRKRQYSPSGRSSKSPCGGFLCTDTGPLVLAIIIYYLSGERHKSRMLLRTLLNHLPVDESCDLLPSELLYGRAGILYGLMKISSCVPALLGPEESDPIVKKQFDHAVQVFTERILQEGQLNHRLVEESLRDTMAVPSSIEATTAWPHALMWTWHNKPYIGGAHGVAGIISVLCSVLFGSAAHPSTWYPMADADGQAKSLVVLRRAVVQIMETVEWVLTTCQCANGNFVTRLGSESDELVHFCHGAPGIVLMLIQVLYASWVWIENHSLLQVDPSTIASFRLAVWQHVVDALDRCVWPKGLLRKGVGLCHGIGGNGFVFLKVEAYLRHEQRLFMAGKHGHIAMGAAFVYNSTQQFDHKRQELFAQAVGFVETVFQVDQLTLAQELAVPDHPWSLMEGRAGAGLLCLQFATNTNASSDASGFPCLNDV